MRIYREDGRRCVKGDAGRAGQIGAQNLHGRTDFARRRLCLHECPKACGQIVDRAKVVGPAIERGSVERSICVLEQTPVGLVAGRGDEGVQKRKCTGWRDFEDRPGGVGSANQAGAVEVAIGGKNQRPSGFEAIVRSLEAVERGQRAARGDLEYRSSAA
jgi:hypothetical protein